MNSSNALYEVVRCTCLEFVDDDDDDCCDRGVDLAGTYPAAYLNQVCQRIQAYVRDNEYQQQWVDCDIEDGGLVGDAAIPPDTATMTNVDHNPVTSVNPESITTASSTDRTSKGETHQQNQKSDNRRVVWIALAAVGVFTATSLIAFGMARRRRKSYSVDDGDYNDSEDNIINPPAIVLRSPPLPPPCNMQLDWGPKQNTPLTPLELLQKSSGVPLGILRRSTDDIQPDTGAATIATIVATTTAISIMGLLQTNGEVQIIDNRRFDTIHEVSSEVEDGEESSEWP
jgi:hypothetical protein